MGGLILQEPCSRWVRKLITLPPDLGGATLKVAELKEKRKGVFDSFTITYIYIQFSTFKLINFLINCCQPINLYHFTK